ncbi:glycoside hydrolase family 3 protein [Microbacterium sp. Au-Mic1]|uniref:glycoside hydrolase family 3 N-terminal domain-containing protein n=1 Tax=Microbacterium sp. Au-Mic1 TaxID=2906457 RepID=UPI001E2F0DA1|nr:glycoside hydrolase family 3 N-terminal domain-containing protein [Microbacterium sp. Au-Mic1]MCE4024559.1 glycoside hydrolase family 3 protein [Microbacterium sp. Au-Mic1]
MRLLPVRPVAPHPARRAGTALLLLTTLLAVTACGSGVASDGPRTTTPSAQTQSPAPSPGADGGSRVREIVNRMDLAQQASSVVMGNVPGTDPASMRVMMSGGFGGFILMGSNMPGTPEELHAMTAALMIDPSLPPLIATDEEGGDVVRLPWDDQPGADVLKAQPADATRAAFAQRGQLLAQSGVTVNFGVVADVAGSPESFIYDRSFGTDPAAAAERVDAAVRGQAPWVSATLKHFPGHGAAEGDSHHMIPSTGMDLATWRAQVAPPFLAGIRAGAPIVMMGHLAYTAVDAQPASLSPRWHQILRDELGFQGVIVTDDLDMLVDSGDAAYADEVADAVRSVVAGSDLVLALDGAGPDTAQKIADGLVAAVHSGALPAARLSDAASRVVALRLDIADRSR